MTVLSAYAWPTNADLIEDVAKLGYLDGVVLDVTFGLGNFWTKWQPSELVGCDIDASKSPIGRSVDFRRLPHEWKRSFDAIVMDPPYKLNGTPDPVVDERYGVHKYVPWQYRHQVIHAGIRECSLALRPKGYFLLKCMDQVCSGKKRWQTMDFTSYASDWGLELVDRFDMLVRPRPQPPGRLQVHSQGGYSTLLVFQSIYRT